jgi:hypothetical protein
MSVVEIMLTAEQLAAAYLQLSAAERHSFLEVVFSDPANHNIALARGGTRGAQAEVPA